MTRRGRNRGGVLAFGLLVVAACGVPLDDRARVTPPERVPYGLVSTTTLLDTPGGRVDVDVYLVEGDRLRPVARTLPAPVEAARLLAELTQPLTEAERADGLRRALGDGALFDEVSTSGETVKLALTEEFERLPAQEQVLALGQIVYTLTELSTVRAVQFSRDGTALDVPTADGTLATGAVDRTDYAALID